MTNTETLIEPIPGGYVRLLGVLGDDLSIINDARQSFDVEHKELTERDEGLINFLIKNKHSTPLEGVEFKFQIKAPIPVAREWMRHRWSSYNEVSGRYVKMAPEFYNPADEAIRTQKGKPGHYVFGEIKDTNTKKFVAQIMEETYTYTYKNYEQLLELGVAKELARNILAQGLFTKFMYKVNARSLLNFLSLRNHPAAMYEIRQYAIAIEDMIKPYIPITYEAFVKNGRVAP